MVETEDRIRVIAEVILKSKSGRSLAKPDEPITAQNIDLFRPSSETVSQATNLLVEKGFEVVGKGPSLTIQSDLSLFEKAFGVKLVVHVDQGGKRPTAGPRDEVKVPDWLEGVAEAIAFPEPITFFD
jgi:hypothetical protein